MKGNMRESISYCPVSPLLDPKKDVIGHMFKDIDNTTIKYRYTILRLDDMLDEFDDATIFSKVD